MKEDVARRLGLWFVPTHASFKAVNSEGSRVLRIATNVSMKIGSGKERWTSLSLGWMIMKLYLA